MEEIIKYVMETPENTNPNILRNYFKDMEFDESNIEEAIGLVMNNLGSLNWNILKKELESLNESSGPKTYRYEDGTVEGVFVEAILKKVCDFIPREKLVGSILYIPGEEYPITLLDSDIDNYTYAFAEYNGEYVLGPKETQVATFADADASYDKAYDKQIKFPEPGLYLAGGVSIIINS